MILDDDALALLVEVDDLRALVAAIPAITDAATAELASGYRRRVKAIIATVVAECAPDKKAARAAWQAYVDAEKARLEGPEALLEALNTRLGTYEACERRAQAIAQQRAAEEARQLEALRGEGGLPLVVPVAPVETGVAGLGFVSHWEVVEDPRVGGRLALIQAVAAGTMPLTCVEPNLHALKDLVRQAKGAVTIPGYEVIETRRPPGMMLERVLVTAALTACYLLALFFVWGPASGGRH